MSICRLDIATEIVATDKQRYDTKTDTRFQTVPELGRAAAGTPRERVTERPTDHGRAQPAQSALGAAHHLGTPKRAQRVSRASGALRSDVARHAFHAPKRTSRGRHRRKQSRWRLGFDGARRRNETRSEGVGRVVGGVGEIRCLWKAKKLNPQCKNTPRQTPSLRIPQAQQWTTAGAGTCLKRRCTQRRPHAYQ